jgi:hypothetical protein
MPPEALGRYFLGKNIMGSPGEIDIHECRAAQIEGAMNFAFELRDFESRFEILLANFIDMEKEMASRTIDNLYRSYDREEQFHLEKINYNRVLLNLLSTARLYVDHTHCNLVRLCQGDRALARIIEKHFSAEYDVSPAYRLLDALRNYSQHRALPIHGMTTGGRWLDMDKETREMENYVEIYLNFEELKSARKFKKSALEPYVDSPRGRIDLKRAVREYIEGFGRIHVAIRTTLSELEKKCKDIVDVARNEYGNTFPSEFGTIGVALFERRSTGRAQVVPIFNGPFEFVDHLRASNRSFANISRRSMSTTHIRNSKP